MGPRISTRLGPAGDVTLSGDVQKADSLGRPQTRNKNSARSSKSARRRPGIPPTCGRAVGLHVQYGAPSPMEQLHFSREVAQASAERNETLVQVIDVRTISERRATNGSPASRESAMDSSAHYFREHQ